MWFSCGVFDEEVKIDVWLLATKRARESLLFGVGALCCHAVFGIGNSFVGGHTEPLWWVWCVSFVGSANTILFRWCVPVCAFAK
jgi:hypothetical protein